MNNLNKIKLLTAIFLTSVFFSACDKADSELEYGFPLIYMPQSTMFSGGLSNNYQVPGGSTIHPNYSIDDATGNVNIILGVYRAGLQELEQFTVEIYSRVDTVNQIVTDGIVTNGALLPADLYSFPSTATVTGGSRETTFHLTLDGAKLNSNYPELAGKTLIVAIGLRNPSKYKLNEALATTVVLINANSFMPLP
jgi:hypothetical protein